MRLGSNAKGERLCVTHVNASAMQPVINFGQSEVIVITSHSTASYRSRRARAIARSSNVCRYATILRLRSELPSDGRTSALCRPKRMLSHFGTPRLAPEIKQASGPQRLHCRPSHHVSIVKFADAVIRRLAD